MVRRRDGPQLRERRLLVERAVWPVRVVVDDVLAQHRLELSAGDNQDAVEAFTPGAATTANDTMTGVYPSREVYPMG